MRIAIDLRLPTYRMGGISQYALHLVPALADLDCGHTFYILHSRKEKRSFLPPEKRNFRARKVWTPCHHRWERWTLGSEIIPLNLDVLHSPDFIPPAWGAKRKVITIHDLNFLYFPQFLTAESRRYYIDQIQWAVETADHISADSEATRQDIISMLGVSKDKVTTVHLAANPLFQQYFEQDEIAKTLKRFELEPGFILFVGTLEPRKNLTMLIKAYNRLRLEKGIKAPLVLIGALGWHAGEILQTIVDLKLTDHVSHLQGVFDRQLAHFYHAAAVLVTPSHYEGFGLPALEAQICCCPVLVSNRGSLPEIVGPQGMTLAADDVQAWVNGIERVLKDKDLQKRLVENGVEQAKKFSWAQTAQKTLQLYEGVI